MSILSIILNTCARTHTSGIEYNERWYTFTMWQTKVRFLANKILIFSVQHTSYIITFDWGNLWIFFLNFILFSLNVFKKSLFKFRFRPKNILGTGSYNRQLIKHNPVTNTNEISLQESQEENPKLEMKPVYWFTSSSEFQLHILIQQLFCILHNNMPKWCKETIGALIKEMVFKESN